MSNVPLPGPPDDESDDDSVAAWHEWHYALDWARGGDFIPLAECLRRSDLPLNNDDVRNWLASGLENGFKKPRKTKKRPQYVPFELEGRRFYLDARYLKIFEAMKQVSETRESLGEDMAIANAAARFEMEPEDLRQHLRRPRSRWGLSPAKHDGMFDGVIGLKD
ncbi:hypothetical protein [Bradyrhizobium sp. USDA 313]|uniref:hypothetical protein n=1 Tax=Bradyrhizobium sp. USDA 313 TaxID=3156307 RepID=UPI003511F799